MRTQTTNGLKTHAAFIEVLYKLTNITHQELYAR